MSANASMDYKDEAEYAADSSAAAMIDSYSQSSKDDDEDDSQAGDCHDDDDDDEYEESGEGDDEQPFWKQHLPAILVALLATVMYHYYQQSQVGNFVNVKQRHEATEKHAYVEDFVRTANISFCPHSLESQGPDSSLELMDFFIPQEYFKILQAFYQADEARDDMYETLPQNYEFMPSENEQYQCLVGQRRTAPQAKTKFRGSTYYFRDPKMEEIYPGLAGTGTDLSEMSRQRRLQQPPLVFTGFAAKFVNLSPKPILLYWDGKGGNDDAKRLVGEIAPFESLGTATMPGHGFHATPVYDSSTALQRWVVTADTALVFFETDNPQELSAQLMESDPVAFAKYQRQLVNQAFARDYLIASQRTWLSHFPRRFPIHYMQPAKYIGQRHQVGDFTLEVASVTPRVFLIDNFLTPEECSSIIDISQKEGMELSTLHSGATAKQVQDLSTRSSSNTWLSRDTNELTEKIYSQAAQVMNIDPELFQKFHESSAHHHSIAESLQVVRYKEGGEEYQPHHDFVYPSINHRYQPTRFATLLIYLNDVREGGATRFPRAVNNYNAEGLEIKPKVGTAVLFYSMLEDGNVDDLSQHGSNPTTKHEKWLANLWVWDPVID